MRETQVILDRLLDKYENSKHLLEPNASKRRVMLRIDKKELPEYDYEDARIRDAYNTAATGLQQQALIQLEWARKRSVLSAIILNLAEVMRCYELTGRMHPRIRAGHVASLLRDSLSDTSVPWIAAWRDAVCEDAQNRLRVPAFCEENDRLLQDLICTFRRFGDLQGSITMRAFSSQCFHDTKYFERNVRAVFLRIARQYCTDLAAICDEKDLSERDQLAFFGIYARPELYELSGDCTVNTMQGEISISAAQPYGLALPSTLVDAITRVDLKDTRCITFIENKTNYDAYLLSEKRPDELVVYHGGFLSPQKKKLFSMIAAATYDVEMRFWADIDLGGFLMFEHLQDLIPQVEPMRMDGRFVEQYHKNGLRRSEEYMAKLEKDLSAGTHLLFSDAIHEILKYGVTIEQESFLD